MIGMIERRTCQLPWTGLSDQTEHPTVHLPCPGLFVRRALYWPCGLIDLHLQVTLRPASQAAMMPLCACLNTHGRLCSTSEVACSILCAVHVSDCGEGCMCYCDRQYWRISGCWRGLLYACDTWYCIPALDLFVCAETVHMLNGLQGWIKAFASVAITCIALQQVKS